MRMLFIHARATSFSSARTESKTQQNIELMTLLSKYFCWMLGDPHFFFRQITSFSDSFHYTKKQKILYVGSYNYFSYTITKGSNWYMDTGVRDLEVVFFKANSS